MNIFFPCVALIFIIARSFLGKTQQPFSCLENQAGNKIFFCSQNRDLTYEWVDNNWNMKHFSWELSWYSEQISLVFGFSGNFVLGALWMWPNLDILLLLLKQLLIWNRCFLEGKLKITFRSIAFYLRGNKKEHLKLWLIQQHFLYLARVIGNTFIATPNIVRHGLKNV